MPLFVSKNVHLITGINKRAHLGRTIRDRQTPIKPCTKSLPNDFLRIRALLRIRRIISLIRAESSKSLDMTVFARDTVLKGTSFTDQVTTFVARTDTYSFLGKLLTRSTST